MFLKQIRKLTKETHGTHKKNSQLKQQNYFPLKEQKKLAYHVKRKKPDFNSLD